MKKTIALIPIYKEKLSPIEEFSLQHSLQYLKNYEKAFIGPANKEKTYYREHFPEIRIYEYLDIYFESIEGYNTLLLNPDFYRQYNDFEFTLILQTDAILIKNDLEKWENSKFDYIGAPWPKKFELNLIWDKFKRNNHKIFASVGNGGFSIRRNKNIINLIEEFPETHHYFMTSKSSEDLFFSTVGAVSNNFIIPNELAASCFSLELAPKYYFKRNGNITPFGGHAWWKYDPEFWIRNTSDQEKSLRVLRQEYNL
jgi:hypothetical protein